MAAENLNNRQFAALLQEEKPLLVDFWAPWCVHCRRIASAYDRIAEQYSRNQLKVILEFLPHDVKREIIDSDKYAYLSEGMNTDASNRNTGSKHSKVISNKPPKRGLFGILKENKNKETNNRQSSTVVEGQDEVEEELKKREEEEA